MGQPKEPNAYEKQLVALGRVLQTLREEENTTVLVETTLSYLQTACDYSLLWLGLYDRLDHCMIGKGGVIPNNDVAFLNKRFTLQPGDILEQVVIEQRPVGVPDLREEMRAGEWRRLARNLNIQGTIIFPIRYRDICYGVVLLGSSLWGVSPSAEEKARLSIILGELATVFHKIEVDWQREQTKHPDEPLLRLLASLRSLPDFPQRLEAVVEETHRFIAPSRTNIYWFERKRRYFWRRVGNLRKAAAFSEAAQAVSGITVQEVSGFYQALISDQLVAIGEAHSSLKAEVTGRLMQLIRARSLLAAPILFQDELIGFLAVEGNEPRIWADEEKRYIRGAAQLVALMAPLEDMEAAIQQTRSDQILTAQVARAIYSDEDWKSTLAFTAKHLNDRFHTERFWVLVYDSDQRHFIVGYQSQLSNRRLLPTPLPPLSALDFQTLELSTEPIAIENLEDDLRFMAWREQFLELGVRSLLVCNTAPGGLPEGVVILTHEATRTWQQNERDLLQIVSQQIGVILHQWQLQRQTDQQQKVHQTIHWGLTALQQTGNVDQLEWSAMQHVAQILQVPLATLVTWQPGRRAGRITAPVVGNNQFLLKPDTVVPVHTDPLIQWVVQSDELLSLSAESLSAETRQWLNAPGLGELLVMALRTTPEHQPMGIVLVADGPGRRWAERHLMALGTLVSQFAWSRRALILTDLLKTQREDLERLNWYKHRRLEDIHRVLGTGIRRLNELGTRQDALTGTRHQQILRQFGNSLAGLTQVLKNEEWRMRIYGGNVALVSLLRRSLEQAEGIVKQRQLWTQVHNDFNLSISGDVLKIEAVLNEVLLAACMRSPLGGRIDIWCRPIDTTLLDLSITDSGVIEPRLLEELQSGRSVDLLAPSTLDQPPGLHLKICQAVTKQLGIDLTFSQLEDNRVLTRLVLPVAAGIPADTSVSNSQKSSSLG